MSRTVTLESKVELFRDLLYEGLIGDLRYGIPDCNVMIKLGCTPQSWSRYRPHLIQYCKYNDLVKTETIDGIDMDTINITMRYDKKNKKWYGKRNQLMIKDQKDSWNEMTLDQQEKFNIIWGSEDFLYTQHN